MRKVYIIYQNFYDFGSKKMTIGGIQTYIRDLATVCLDIGFEPHIIQPGSEEKKCKLDNIVIEQYIVSNKSQLENYKKEVVRRISPDEVVIFATDSLIPLKNHFKKLIVIQHGITWDIPIDGARGQIRAFLSKSKDAYKVIERLHHVQRIICVDYNFVNWYRTQVDRTFEKLSVIPNYAKIAPVYHKEDKNVNIIFARRLFTHRGTRVFTAAIKKVLEKFNNVNITIAGSGPDEKWMKEELDIFGNVQFIQYDSKDSMRIHSDKHIAVVPTVGSEGTSLSLLEAMSAQCAVIASDVGGMTNIVIDGFNGLLVSAGSIEQLSKALEDLIQNPKYRNELAAQGYETVKKAFSYERWAEKWKYALTDIAK